MFGDLGSFLTRVACAPTDVMDVLIYYYYYYYYYY